MHASLHRCSRTYTDRFPKPLRKVNQAGTATEEEPPGLFTLPAELRNEIYRLVLLSQSRITIGARNHEQPALLRTCRQLREETSSIFYDENRFLTRVQDMRMVIPASHWCITRIRAPNFSAHMSGTMSWSNTLKWLERYYRGEAIRLGSVPNCGPDRIHMNVAAHIFGVVDRLRKKLKWKDIVPVLEEVRQMVDDKDGTWSWAP